MGITKFSGVFVVWFLSAILSGFESTAVADEVFDALESNSTQHMMPGLQIGATLKDSSSLNNP